MGESLVTPDLQFWINAALALGLQTVGILTIWLLVEVKAMQRSTHQVTYVDPLAGITRNEDGQFAIPPLSEDETKELRKKPDSFDNLG